MKRKSLFLFLVTLSILTTLYSTYRIQLEHGVRLPKSTSNLNAPIGILPILFKNQQMNHCSFTIKIIDVNTILNQYEIIHFEKSISSKKYRYYNALNVSISKNTNSIIKFYYKK
jgi:hypothetical protein